MMQRPRLLRGRENPRLWISGRGTSLSKGALYGGIRSCTKRLFGAEINPHLFRDIAATFVSEEAPNDRAIVADILGHTGLATSQAHYDHASSLRAQQKLVDVIDRIAWD